MSASVASADGYHADSSSPLTVNKPASTASGDLLLLAIAQGGSTLSALTAPSGWAIPTNGSAGSGSCTGKFWYKVAGSSEPSTYDFPYEGGADVAAICFRVTGADTTPTLVCASTSNGPNGGSVDSPTVTPTGSDDALIVVMAVAAGGSALVETDPSGTTDLGQAQESTFQAIAAAWQALASSSATGAKTWTSITPGTKPGLTFSLAIKSATGGGSSPALADAGSEADSLTVAAAVPLAEAGAGAQSVTVAAAVPLADAGSAAESSAVAATVPLADGGSAAEALTIAATVPLADAGSEADSGTAGVAIAQSDSASGAEALTVAAAAPLANGGSAADTSVVAATVPLADVGSAADTLAIVVPTALADAGSAAQSIVVAAAVPLGEGGAAAEALTVAVTLALADAGAEVDAFTGGSANSGLIGNAHGPLPLAAGSVIVHTGTIAGAVT